MRTYVVFWERNQKGIIREVAVPFVLILQKFFSYQLEINYM